MNKTERMTGLLVSLLYFVRMLGLFSILPIFTLAANDDYAAGSLMIGVTLGIYGLLQAGMQIPFGILSDRLGRKSVLVFGLVLFVLGSWLAAVADSIWGILLGRALQGAGAIAGVLLAVVADEIRPEWRASVMAMIGASIGVAFGLSLILGPLIYDIGGLSAVFYLGMLTGALALGLVLVMPFAAVAQLRVTTEPTRPVRGLSQNAQFQWLNLSIFINHFLLMSSFLVIPRLLVSVEIAVADHSWIYLGVLFGSFMIMLPAIIRWGKSQVIIAKVVPAILIMILGLLLLALGVSAAWVLLGLLVFFVGFNYLEATLPALVSQVAPEAVRGKAMGIYSTSQFLGLFAGGSLGGLWMAHLSLSAVLVANGALALGWVVLLLVLNFREQKIAGAKSRG